MRAWRAVVVMATLLSACAGSRQAPPPASEAEEIDFEALPTGKIRILVAGSRTHYRLVGGQRSGATVRAGTALERWVNERIVPKTIAVEFVDTPEDALVRDLLAGKGDVAANLLLTFERDDQVAFAKPLVTGIREIVVTGSKEPPLVSLEDVGGRSIHVRKASDHFASLTRLNDQLKKIDRPQARVVIAPAEMTDEDLLDQVNAGTIPATLVDDYVFNACCAEMSGLRVNRDVAVSQDGSLSWVTRKDAPKLLAVINEFFATHKLAF